MVVYHGSKHIVEMPAIQLSGYQKDFYYGFYCIQNEEQAKRWAVRYNGHGIINEYRYEKTGLLKTSIFKEMTEDWLNFISECRLGKSHDYDVVEGPMVTDQIFSYVQDYTDGKISREAFWELVKDKKPPIQVSFHTVRGLLTLQFIKGRDVYE